MASSANRLGFGPRIQADGTRLVASTSLLLQLLLLLSYHRRVTIDRRTLYVRIHTRFVWLFHRDRLIRFNAIDHVDYDYIGIGVFETFVVSVVLRDRSEVTVASFWGKPPEVPYLPLPLVYLPLEGDGDQEERSRDLVDLLTRYVDAPLGPQIALRKGS